MTAGTGFLWRLLATGMLGLLLSIGWQGAAQAQTNSTCAAAATRGTAPADFRDYCWLSFTNYNDTAARNGGQNYRFALPDGTVITLRLEVDNFSGGSGTRLAAVGVPSWSGSAFGNTAFIGIPGTPVLYNAQNATSVRVRLRNIQVTPPTGGVASYSIIAADGESSNNDETLQFITNGNDWQRVAAIQNGTSTTFPGESFAGTNTVTLTGVAGTVGSYVYRSDGQPTEVSATIDGGGLQGVIFGVRYASVAAVSQVNTSRYYPADQFTYSLRTGAGTTLVSGTTAGAGLNGFAPAVMPTVAASYPFHVVQAMAPGSQGTLANYTTTLTCVNANTSSSTPMPTNQPINPGSPGYVFNNLQYRDSVLCTFTNTPIFSSVAGTVYSDANRNGSRDASEAGVGAAGLFVKLVPVSGGACTGPAHQAVAVTSGTGAFNVPNVPQGEYCLVLDTNNTLADVTPTLPAGWIGLQNGSGSVRVSIPAGNSPESPQSFGLFNGSRLAGSVFADTGSGGGVANDGTRQAGEGGFAGLTVRAASGATTVASDVTSGDGSFELWLPAGATALTIGPAQVPTGQLASGGSAGNTGGGFSRPDLVFTPVAGQQYSGVAIGLVPSIELAPNGNQAGLPGSAVFYPHTFQAGSAGQVSFSVSASAAPALTGWTAIVYRDSNCSATLDGSEPVLSSALTVTANEVVCLVVKQFVPAGATHGAQNTLTLTAQFNYTNASPTLAASATVLDVTIVGEPAALVLQKRVSNFTRGGPVGTSVNASPGEVLQYTLTAQNQGSTPLTTLVINDTTPAFTTFVSGACPAPLPAGITGCSVTTQPAVGAPGAVQWTFTGELAPTAQLGVNYRVRLDQ